MDRVKNCPRCGETKPSTEFYVRGGNRAGELSSYCRACTCTYVKTRPYYGQTDGRTPAKRHRENIRWRYKLTVGEYEALLEAQGHACAICYKPDRRGFRLSVDHDRSCCPSDRSCGDCVRGLLCNDCNKGLGAFKDDPAALVSAAEYLCRPRTKRPRAVIDKVS